MYSLHQNFPKMNHNQVFSPSYTYYNTADPQHGINTFSEPILSTSVNNFMNQYPLSFNNIAHLNEKIDKPEGKAIHNCLDDAKLPNMTQQSMIVATYSTYTYT